MKHLKIMASILGVTVLVTGSFAFTSKTFHKPFAATNYVFTDATINSSTVVVSSNYTVESSNPCTQPREEYCEISIDPSANPEYVNSDGSLNFSNTTLNSDVTEFFNTISEEGKTVDGITFHFKAD